MKVAGDLAAHRLACRLVPEEDRAQGERRDMCSGEAMRRGIVIAGDPDPVAAGL